jgi:hypothetical protein
MILLHEANRELPVRSLPSQSQIASSASAVDASAEDQNVEGLPAQTLDCGLSSVWIDDGSHVNILVVSA